MLLPLHFGQSFFWDATTILLCYVRHLPEYFKTILVGLKPAPAVPPAGNRRRQNVEAPSLCQATMPAFYLFLKSNRDMVVITQDGSRIWSRFDYTEKVENDDGNSAT